MRRYDRAIAHYLIMQACEYISTKTSFNMHFRTKRCRVRHCHFAARCKEFDRRSGKPQLNALHEDRYAARP
jgi:hypothetical protein